MRNLAEKMVKSFSITRWVSLCMFVAAHLASSILAEDGMFSLLLTVRTLTFQHFLSIASMRFVVTLVFVHPKLESAAFSPLFIYYCFCVPPFLRDLCVLGFCYF